MSHLLFLIVSYFTLIFVIRKIVSLEKIVTNKYLKEVQQHLTMLILSTALIVLIGFITYSMWKFTGSLYDWNGVYITGATMIATFGFTFIYYYLRKSKYS
ncbi:hypothetical protein [Bacillus solimangrovi]|uniref:hypothetical protein n=1 Tax=Bacillus solimangrovi TaxID=1305675 RepID=UPI001112D64E|nr:hypothetical protein [Bacillus solimangrovi]